MIKKAHRHSHEAIRGREEEHNPSSGYWPEAVRIKTVELSAESRGKVLEVGCGEGLLLTRLAKTYPGLDIFGIDSNPAQIERARRKLEKNHLNNVRVCLQDAENISFADESFDRVICVNFFYNMASEESVRRVLKSMNRVCKKGGRMIFDFRNALNPLLWLKYRFAVYYDKTTRGLPLKTYRPEHVKSILKDSGLTIKRSMFMGLPILKRLAPIIMIEAEKRC